MKNKSKADKLEQVKKIMRKLEKRGQNKEWINDIYRELIKKEDTRYVAGCDSYTEPYRLVIWDTSKSTFEEVSLLNNIILNKDFNHPANVLKDPDFKPNNI